MKVSEMSSEELQKLHEQGRLAKCPVCGRYEETPNKWPFYNQALCKQCGKEIKWNKQKK